MGWYVLSALLMLCILESRVQLRARRADQDWSEDEI